MRPAARSDDDDPMIELLLLLGILCALCPRLLTAIGAAVWVVIFFMLWNWPTGPSPSPLAPVPYLPPPAVAQLKVNK
jgi:hypothetical protein